MSRLGDCAYITKLAGFEHTKYIQGNISHKRTDKYDIPLFIGKTVRDGKIDKKYDWYLPHEISDQLPRSQLNKKCIVMPYVGTLGDLAIFDADERCHLGSNIAKIELASDCGYSEEFVYYFIKSPWGQNVLFRDVQGGVQKNITMESIRDIELPSYSPEMQSHIVYVLSLLDKKIENNNAICADLEAMAKLLYDYWFVQFDFPDENGKPYKSSGGKMVWNEDLKREIPEGWEVKPLGELITVIRGISYKPTDERKEPGADTIALLKSNNIQNGSVNFDQPVYLPNSLADADQWLTKGSVFITMSSGSKAHMGKTAVIYRDLPYVFGAFCAKISIVEKANCFVSTYFRSDWFRAYIENVTAGTSINNISNDQLIDILIPMPNADLLEHFEVTLRSSFDKQGELVEENRLLSSLRDFLLPMLMNGQVKLGDKDDLPPVAYPTDEAWDEYMIAAEPQKAYDAEGKGV